MQHPGYYIVRHGFSHYVANPREISWIEEKSSRDSSWRNLARGDKIILSSPESPKGIIGLFRIVSDRRRVRSSRGASLRYAIEPLYVPNGDPWPMKINYKRDLGLRIETGGTISRLDPSTYRKIKSLVLGMDEPVNHDGIIALFSKVHRTLGYRSITAIQREPPDALVEDDKGRQVKIEFEFDSSDYRRDMERGTHRLEDCEVVVCWKDSWGTIREREAPRLEVRPLEPLYGSQ